MKNTDKKLFMLLMKFLGILVFGLIPPSLYAAGGAFVIDDAAIASEGEIELQTWWARESSDLSQFVIAPAFPVTARLEATVELVLARESQNNTELVVFEAKYLARDFEHKGWGYAFVLGREYSLNRARRSQVDFFYLPFSYQLSDVITAHLNLGVERDILESETDQTWGLGAEFSLQDSLTAIGSIFGADSGRSGYELGLRYSLLNQQLEVDLIYIKDLEAAADDWFVVGLNYFI